MRPSSTRHSSLIISLRSRVGFNIMMKSPFDGIREDMLRHVESQERSNALYERGNLD